MTPEEMQAKLDATETLVASVAHWQEETDARTTCQVALLDLVVVLGAVVEEVRLLGSYRDWNRSWMRATNDLTREERQRTLSDLERVRNEAESRIALLRGDEAA